MRFNFLNKYRDLPKSLGTALLPDKETVDSNKKAFLAHFDASHGTVAKRGLAFGLKVAAVTMVAVIALVSGASVYADTQNIPANSVFYPLKRLSESIRLALAKPQDKPKLQADLAERRVQEIDYLVQQKSSLKKVPQLENDLNSSLLKSIKYAKESGLSGTDLGSFCNQVSSIIAMPSSTAAGGSLNNPHLLEMFYNQCEEQSQRSQQVQQGKGKSGQQSQQAQHGKSKK